ncbi:MAG TPA: ABC transporter permease [Bryobacteraceae bacterium]
MSWFSRLRNAWNPRRLDADLDEEMRDHLERRAAALEQKGEKAEEAHRKARLRFGNATRLHEESRGFRLWTGLETTLQDIRYGWRGMRRSPGFTVTAVLSLGLAIGAITAIYSIVDAAVLMPLPVSKPDQLFRLAYPAISGIGSSAIDEWDSFSYPMYQRFLAASGPAARLAAFSNPESAEVQRSNSGATSQKVTRQFVSGNAFDLLGVSPALGRLLSPDDNRMPSGRAVAVLSYDYWNRRFDRDPKALGQLLQIDGKPYQIVGVARQGFWGVEPGRFVDIWVPATTYNSQALAGLDWHWLRIIGRLAPGVIRRQFQARLQPSFHQLQMELIKSSHMMPAMVRKQFLSSVIRVHPAATGVSDFRQTFSRPLWIVFGVALGILLIACANVASLLLARATARRTEMAMRVSLGAARKRLIRQMLTESLMLSLAAGALGWLFARIIAPLVVSAISTQGNPVQLALATDIRVLLFCIAVSTLAAVLFGLAPAWQASGVQPMLALRSSTGQASKLRLGKWFVSIQVACAFCMVMVGAAFLFSLGNLLRVNPGFDARNVAVLNLTMKAAKSDDPVAYSANHPGEQTRLRNLMFQIQQRVATQPGIQSAALAWWPIFEGGGWSERVIMPGKGPSERQEIFYRVSPKYFAALHTPLISGRDFRRRDSTAPQPIPAIVNEAFARRYFHGLNVLGRQFSYPFPPSPVRVAVVGVVADARYYNLRQPADPIVYLPLEATDSFTLYVRSPLNLGQIVRIAGHAANAVGSGMQIREATTLETIVGNTLLREKLLAGVGGAFAFFGLLLAAIGLFGLLSYSVGRRRKEMGIRVALGAQRGEIVALVLKDVTGLMGGGLIAGLAGALAIITVFRSLLFRIPFGDPWVIGTAIALFLLTGLLAAGLPAHRAATVDPVRALREE